LHLLSLADYVRATLDDGENVPRIAPYHVGVGLNWEAPAFGGGFVFRYTGRQDEIGVAETETAGFTSLDADASWRPFKDEKNVELVLVGRNLTDTTQRNAVALNKDDVILPGREVRFLIRASL
jgi:iron complex outermembrane receptor protein